MTGIPRTTLMLLLSLALPMAGFAQDRAMLYPGAGITVNGRPTSITSAVLSGDTIQTGKGAAQLVYNGATVEVEPGTSFQYGSSLQLGCGGIAIAGAMPIAVAGTAIAP
ncbi:MAG TPA: hypothetical protein VFM10_11540, partial [Terriglobales bacterium]|nr:hypothetical protein [Terriglobales bacterium]